MSVGNWGVKKDEKLRIESDGLNFIIILIFLKCLTLTPSNT